MSESSASAPQLRESFAENLTEVESWFTRKGIEHRVIGSLATSAYVDGPEGTGLNFCRPHTVQPQDRVPDIDIIVPRADLPEVRRYRQQLLQSESPVGLGLSFPSRFVDYRPDREDSFLVAGRESLAVPSSTFEAVNKPLLTTELTTISPATLYYTHLMVGIIREKDAAKVQALEPIAKRHGSDEPDYDNFKAYAAKKSASPDVVDEIKKYIGHVESHPVVGKTFQRLTLAAASLLRLR